MGLSVVQQLEKDIEKDQGEKIGKYIVIEVNKKRIFFNGQLVLLNV